MARIKGKVQLCSCEIENFKSQQGYAGKTLIERFSELEIIIKKSNVENDQHFLAQPIQEEGTITWYSKIYKETPEKLKNLSPENLAIYQHIKEQTIERLKNISKNLIQEGKNQQSELLENALKFISDDFIYCYDGIVVLGIWGMQIREDRREPLGTYVKSLFSKKPTSPKIVEVDPVVDFEPENNTPNEEVNNQFYNIRFDANNHGSAIGNIEIQKAANEFILSNEIPRVEPNAGYEFIGWDRNPNDFVINNNETFTAQYRLIPPIVPVLPWYLRFWNWLKALFLGRGCLRWLLWLLLILLLLFLLFSLLKGCGGTSHLPIIGNDSSASKSIPIEEKPWVNDDPRVGKDGGIYDPGNPYEKVPTPPEYTDVLPPNQGELPSLDTTKIIREPGQPSIVSNRLNVLMENEDKSIMDLAKEFKVKYPDSSYKVVYYDNVVKRMQIEVPPSERNKIKEELPLKFKPNYDLFVFDESLFEESHTPTDPAYNTEENNWYFNAINANTAWDITKGSSKVTVAIVDNGFSLKHPELNSKVVMPYNVWLHSNQVYANKIDHGTHVAGTALALMDNGKGLCGIAPNCSFMPIVVANKEGIMTTTSILDGILYALYQGADVVNVSLGMQINGTIPEDVQKDLQKNHFKEEERLWNKIMQISNKHNSVIVVAAGNDNVLAGINALQRPKNFIIVSASDKNNQALTKAGFSNYGEYSTISAPGVGIYSSVGDNGYQVMEGTSMAAPIITGAVALMKSLNDSLTAEQIICILQNTGKATQGNIGKLIQLDKAVEAVKNGDIKNCGSRPSTPSTGDVQVLLSWDNYNDLDLAVSDPNGESVWFRNKKCNSGGLLEIDMNVEYPDNKKPIENIYWPVGKAPNGTYNVYLIYFKKHLDIDETNYKITVKYGNKTDVYPGKIKKVDGNKFICSFTLGAPSINQPSESNGNEALLKERKRLQDQLNKIDKELENIRKNNNFKK